MSLTKVSYSMIDSAPMSVKDFGATGNGVTDDTVAIQNAITYLAVNGGSLVFPSATYLISNQIILPFGNNGTSKIYILDFFGSTIKSNVATPTNTTFTGFISGYLDASNQAVANTTGTETYVAANVLVKDVFFEGFGTAIRLNNFNYGCAFENVYVKNCFNGINLSRCFYLIINNAFLTGNGKDVSGVGFRTTSFSNIMPMTGIKSNFWNTGMQLGGFDGGKMTDSSVEGCNIGVDFVTESTVINLDTIYMEANTVANMRFGAVVRRLYLTNSWSFADADKHIISTMAASDYATMTAVSTLFFNGVTNSPPILNIFGDLLGIVSDPLEAGGDFSGIPNVRAVSPNYEIDTSSAGYNGPIRSLNVKNTNGIIPTAYGGRFRNSRSLNNRSPFQTVVNNADSLEFTTQFVDNGFTALLWQISIAHFSATYAKTFLIFYDSIDAVWRLYEPLVGGLTTETTATCTNSGGFLMLKAPTFTTPVLDFSFVRTL